jgi:hypothetical protein
MMLKGKMGAAVVEGIRPDLKWKKIGLTIDLHPSTTQETFDGLYRGSESAQDLRRSAASIKVKRQSSAFASRTPKGHDLMLTENHKKPGPGT